MFRIPHSSYWHGCHFKWSHLKQGQIHPVHQYFSYITYLLRVVVKLKPVPDDFRWEVSSVANNIYSIFWFHAMNENYSYQCYQLIILLSSVCSLAENWCRFWIVLILVKFIQALLTLCYSPNSTHVLLMEAQITLTDLTSCLFGTTLSV